MGTRTSRLLSEGDEENNATNSNTRCPIYEAALVGDWSTLSSLCENSIMTTEEDEERLRQYKLIEESRRGRMEWIASLDVLCSSSIGSPVPSSSSIPLDTSSHATETDSLNSQSSHQRMDSICNYTLFVDDRGNTALHLACRRDPPFETIHALLAMHRPMVWMKSTDGSLPLHVACHCGCDVSVIEELIKIMEITPRNKDYCMTSKSDHDDDATEDRCIVNEDDDPLLPRDNRGRTPLHLACASSRDSNRRPDCIRLLLLRSNDPRRAVLSKDWLGNSGVGLDCAIGQLKIISGGMLDHHESIRSICGRTPLDLIEDDYREEIDGELSAQQVAMAIASQCCTSGSDHIKLGGDNCVTINDKDTSIATLDDDKHRLDDATIYECWATLSILLLAAGTLGAVEQIKEALGGGDTAGPKLSILKPCHEVVCDFQRIYKACNELEKRDNFVCPVQFKDLAKKLVQGQVDARSLGTVTDLKSMWESLSG
jgi:ankyrin repeat protein